MSADAPPLPSGRIVTPFGTLEQAADAVVELIAEGDALALWAVVKIEDGRWVPLACRDRHYGVRRGVPMTAPPSLLAAALAGENPLALPDVAAAGLHADGVAACVFHPVHDGDGSLFGAVCALDPDPAAFEPVAMLRRAHAAARMMTSHLALEQRVQDTRRRAERAELDSRTDPMTGVLNRRGWELAMAQEQARIARTGGSAAVVLVDLDGLKRVNDSHGHEAGDALILRCARVLAGQVRSLDVVGRLGGDEFAMLLSGIDRHLAGQVIERIRLALERADVRCTMTWSWAGVLGSLAESLAEADMLLIEHKRRCGREAEA